MSEKRKDKKGRVLKSGESQRANGGYQYRYTDIKGKRKYIYASTLEDLRDREAEIQKVVFNDGLDYCAGEITVLELVEKYLKLKQGMRYNTQINYEFVLGILKDEDFSYRQIKTIKKSDAKNGSSSSGTTADAIAASKVCAVSCVRLSRWRWMRTS